MSRTIPPAAEERTPSPADTPLDWSVEFSHAGVAETIIRRRVRALERIGAMRPEDAPDLAQELRIAVIRNAGDFDPANGRWRGFVRAVVRRAIQRWLRTRGRKQAAFERSIGLLGDQPAALDEEGEELDPHGMVGEHEVARWSGRVPFDGVQELIDAEDWESRLSRLDPELRSLAKDLMRMPLKQAKRARGWSRRRLEHQVERLREVFSDIRPISLHDDARVGQ